MWRSYIIVKILLRKSLDVDVMGIDLTEPQDVCDRISQQLEREQHCFDNKPGSWKKSLHGRSHARILYRLYSCLNEIENGLRLIYSSDTTVS